MPDKKLTVALTTNAVVLIGCGLWVALTGWVPAVLLGFFMAVVGAWALGVMLGVNVERKKWSDHG